MRQMQIRLVFIFSFVHCIFQGYAQLTPLEIKYKAWDIHALRYYPFKQPADSFMIQIINRKHILSEKTASEYYEKIAVNLTMNKQYLEDVINRSTARQNLIYKHVVRPYNAWLSYASPIREDSWDLKFPLFLSERYLKGNQQTHFSAQSPLEIVSADNIQYCLEEWLGKIDILKERNEVLFLSIKSPLAKDAEKTYRYFFSSRTETEGIPVYEIAFFSRKFMEKAYEGYLYISIRDSSLVKAIFTLNPQLKKAPAKTVLFIQTPSNKETLLSIGDEITIGLLIEQISLNPSILQPFNPSILQSFVSEARNTRAFSNLQNGISLLLTDQTGIFRKNFNLGPITQMFSYNYTEGARLRVGGYTSQKISKQASIGGYLAYGTKDERWKYRGDIIYYPRLKDQLRFTYVNDLNIPGQDCLEDKRDRIFYSLYQSHTKNMSLQKIEQLSYETEGFHPFSLKLHTKHTYDQPLGIVKYETVNNGVHATVNDITTSEIGASFRFSPNERYLRIKGKRIVFCSPDVDIKLSHRIGIRGILGSNFNYHITDAALFKSFDFPLNTGSFGVRLSGGKVWNSVPFPLLFIPEGNQSYVFEENDYNLMRFYEFITDRFVAGKADLQINWSPVKVFFPKSKMKMHGGIKAIYGPLSDKNNPQLHTELFILNNGVEALGKKTYAEANIGLSGILNYLRIDYVYRFTYGNKGLLFVSTAFNL